MDGRLPDIERRYEELESLSVARRQALEGALALYRMFSEAGACQLWVEEKEQWLHGMEIPTKLEDLEVVQQRLVWAKDENDKPTVKKLYFVEISSLNWIQLPRISELMLVYYLLLQI